jgi:hypothetical protein
MRALLPIAAAGFVLAGCQTASTDAQIRASLRTICPVIDQLHAAFMVVAARGKVSDNWIDQEQKAYAGLSVACLNIDNASVQTLPVLIASIYVAWDIAGVK